MGRPNAPPCRHCEKNKGFYGRGLCLRCHKDPQIRKLYKGKFPTPRPDNGLTAESLDAMVAERMRNLPEWWAEEARSHEAFERRNEPAATVKILVVRDMRFVGG